MRERGWEAALKNELAFESEKRSQSSAGSIERCNGVNKIRALPPAYKSNALLVDWHASKNVQEDLLYRVRHRVPDLDWVDFDLHVPLILSLPSCSAHSA